MLILLPFPQKKVAFPRAQSAGFSPLVAGEERDKSLTLNSEPGLSPQSCEPFRRGFERRV